MDKWYSTSEAAQMFVPAFSARMMRNYAETHRKEAEMVRVSYRGTQEIYSLSSLLLAEISEATGRKLAEAIAGEAEADRKQPEAETTPRKRAEGSGRKSGEPTALQMAQSEIAFLRDALQREQETSRRAMDAQNALATELAEARKQASVLIAATAGAFGTFAGDGDRNHAQRIASSDTQERDTPQGAVSTPPEPSEGQNTSTGSGDQGQETGRNQAGEKPRPWWLPKWPF